MLRLCMTWLLLFLLCNVDTSMYFHVCVQPGSSGRDVDTSGQEAVGLTDDAKWKSTRASPALAHGADEGFSMMKEQSELALSAGNEGDNLAATPLQNRSAAATVAAADDRPSVKNGYNSVRSLKHKNDQSYKYGTGSSDLHRASSLQDFTDSAIGKSHPSATENTVSCCCAESDNVSDVCHLHGMLSSLSSNACSTDSGCARCDRSSITSVHERSLSSQCRSRCRMQRSATNLELESVGSTGIVSNTARFWEGLALNSSSSVAQCKVRPRHVSEDRSRFMQQGVSSQRYSTVGTPCDIQPVHGMVCMPRTMSTQPESLHVNGVHEVCFCYLCYSLFCYIFVACLYACAFCFSVASVCF